MIDTKKDYTAPRRRSGRISVLRENQRSNEGEKEILLASLLEKAGDAQLRCRKLSKVHTLLIVELPKVSKEYATMWRGYGW